MPASSPRAASGRRSARRCSRRVCPHAHGLPDLARAAQGSATVAILTTAGLLSASILGGGYSTIQVALLALAIAFGALGLSHVNDSGFWVVTRYLGLGVADGLRTWTVLTTVLGLVGFLLCYVVWLVAGVA
ncbi:hypothetical protein [Pseudoclavibacter helvolus]|uniref:GntT/GntP/DsdX family permease n=1 Tax=Pseudoclavibacter helvolus TaxID=255205 RepID=UPI0024AD025D|nr:hypothetical protein [Pseudoclavibacter helvolus]